MALGNLLPPDADVDELDSYMYQTVGHHLVEAYAACTGLPLYRRRIHGGAKSQVRGRERACARAWGRLCARGCCFLPPRWHAPSAWGKGQAAHFVGATWHC